MTKGKILINPKINDTPQRGQYNNNVQPFVYKQHLGKTQPVVKYIV